jgi:hypothetical protein
VLSVVATNTKFIVFDLIRSELEPTKTDSRTGDRRLNYGIVYVLPLSSQDIFPIELAAELKKIALYPSL